MHMMEGSSINCTLKKKKKSWGDSTYKYTENHFFHPRMAQISVGSSSTKF